MAISTKADQASQDAQTAKAAADEALMRANEAIARAEAAEKRAAERERIAEEKARQAEPIFQNSMKKQTQGKWRIAEPATSFFFIFPHGVEYGYVNL